MARGNPERRHAKCPKCNRVFLDRMLVTCERIETEGCCYCVCGDLPSPHTLVRCTKDGHFPLPEPA